MLLKENWESKIKLIETEYLNIKKFINNYYSYILNLIILFSYFLN